MGDQAKLRVPCKALAKEIKLKFEPFFQTLLSVKLHSDKFVSATDFSSVCFRHFYFTNPSSGNSWVLAVFNFIIVTTPV